MLNFLGGLLKGVGIVVGTAFISVEGFFSTHQQPAAPTPVPTGVATSSQIAAPTVQSGSNSSPSIPKPSQPTVPVQPPIPSTSSVTPEEMTAQIKAAQDAADTKATLAAQETAEIAAQQATKRSADLAAQQAIDTAVQQATQEKQNKLNAINKQIADLGAKYAADVANADNIRADMSYINGTKQVLYTKYIQAYNILVAQYQQIQYSN